MGNKAYDYFIKFLIEAGIEYKEKERGWCLFSFSGSYFFVIKTDDGPILSIYSGLGIPATPRTTLLEYCNDANLEMYTKFAIPPIGDVDEPDQIWCTYELQPTANMKTEEWFRILKHLDQAGDKFLDEHFSE